MRVPIPSGTRVAVVHAPDDAVVLMPPAPGPGIADVGAAVRDALRFPLAGPSLAQLARRRGRATIVVEPPALPLPGASLDPRQPALAAAIDELERSGVPGDRQTLLVAGGLTRRADRRALELLVPPEVARRFRGRVVVHDAEDPALVEVGSCDGTPLRVNPALVETDVVTVVTAAESVLHGGPAALLAAANPEALRAAGATSLFEPSGSGGWRCALALERLLAARTGLVGVSLALHHPRFGGPAHGYPYDPAALERIAGSRLQPLYQALPRRLRAVVLESLRAELTAAAVLAGPPSVAHAEALLRGIESRSTALDGRLDAICIGIPHVTPHLPREPPNPVLVAFVGLALALRMWRSTFPVADGGTAILVHGLRRRFAHPTQQPYRVFLAAAARSGREPGELAAAEREAAADARSLAEYRGGRACHPLLPFLDWAACAPALERLGAVLVAGCRDAVAARQLGFIPVHSVAAALEMARGRAGGSARLGVLVSPPYYPIRVEE